MDVYLEGVVGASVVEVVAEAGDHLRGRSSLTICFDQMLNIYNILKRPFLLFVHSVMLLIMLSELCIHFFNICIKKVVAETGDHLKKREVESYQSGSDWSKQSHYLRECFENQPPQKGGR